MGFEQEYKNVCELQQNYLKAKTEFEKKINDKYGVEETIRRFCNIEKDVLKELGIFYISIESKTYKFSSCDRWEVETVLDDKIEIHCEYEDYHDSERYDWRVYLGESDEEVRQELIEKYLERAKRNDDKRIAKLKSEKAEIEKQIAQLEKK